MNDYSIALSSSLVDSTLTTDCFSFNGLSLDQRGIPLPRHRARNGESSLSGENSSASLRNGAIASFGTNFIYTSFLCTFSHMPFLTILPSSTASSSVNMISDAMASNNSSSAATFLIASSAIPDQSIEACLRITLLRSSGIRTVTSDMDNKMMPVDLIISEFDFKHIWSVYPKFRRI